MSGSENIQVGVLSVSEAWNTLRSSSDSELVDVRTQAEWTFVGVADLSSVGREPILVEWQTFPDNQINPNFVDWLVKELMGREATPETHLFFLCRSGVRSLAAAKAMATVGYGNCKSVAGGFEGPLDEDRHRGTVSGWKAAGLPWRQG